jgi:hypothetical protein
MAIEIANLATALCAVSVPAQGNPIVPKFSGPGTREFANAGFFPFAPAPAGAGFSERVMAGVYRMNLLTPFSFSGGMGAAFCTPNTTDDQGLDFTDSISFTAVGVDFGAASGTNVLVSFFNGGPGSESPGTHDSDFSLLVLRFPTQQTPN